MNRRAASLLILIVATSALAGLHGRDWNVPSLRLQAIERQLRFAFESLREVIGFQSPSPNLLSITSLTIVEAREEAANLASLNERIVGKGPAGRRPAAQ